jgi:uncharacterized protein YbjT (DUF2867 family)
MKVVVIGGTGLVGSEVVTNLQAKGHDAVAASPDSGVNAITGEGLAEALAGADVVVDASNAPDFGDAAALNFFQTSSHNLIGAAATAGVEHYVAFSIVGADRLPDSGYLRAKVAQEEVVKGGSLPFTIVRSTQFFEFAGRIADSSTNGSAVHLPPVLFQPAAAAEIGALVADIAVGEPANGVVEVGGPEPLRFDQVIAAFLASKGDARQVIADPHARYFGTELNTESLTTGDGAHLTSTHFDDWLGRQ